MAEIKLSKRLEKVASFVDKGAYVADIGSDHAYLPVYLIKNGIAKKAIAGEVNEGPLQSAIKQVKKHGLENKIQPRLGSGLSVIKGEAPDTVVIAGMGGPLISQILEEGKEDLEAVRKLILQPNVAADSVRRWLIENEWKLTQEAIMEEDGHIYEILTAEKGDPLALYSENTEKEIWLGPLLLKEKNSAFKKKWNRELRQLENIRIQLDKASDSGELLDRKKEVEKKAGWIKEELT
ncbi:tRNA (adenine(22)-N(1))-methyltransferase [Evansella clarkii]|uniref:tRNA (adenine(22)-N(1))-methyltransferase n=1 Tax=Evansella clarkii TaxID=79879 RepID=UPI000B432E56|nr:tRNA (adenine(22)-N(1))-methyltransferase TrmK [Evansella clarkii]